MRRAYSRAVMRGAALFLGVTTATMVALACGSKVDVPQYTGQPTEALAPVPYPPPPARAENIPDSPSKGAVWIDGEWVWQTRRYAWRKGRWIMPPSGAKFAPWTTVRDKTGNLYIASGVWRSTTDGSEVQEPAPINQGKPKGGDVVSPEGDSVEVGSPATSANLMHPGGKDRRAGHELEALDASGPPSLAIDAAVSDQLLEAGAAERAPAPEAGTP